MYFRTGSTVADLTLDKDGRIDCFEGFDRFFGLVYVPLEWHRGRSKTMASKPALAASTAFVREWV